MYYMLAYKNNLLEHPAYTVVAMHMHVNNLAKHEAREIILKSGGLMQKISWILGCVAMLAWTVSCL